MGHGAEEFLDWQTAIKQVFLFAGVTCHDCVGLAFDKNFEVAPLHGGEHYWLTEHRLIRRNCTEYSLLARNEVVESNDKLVAR